MVLALHALCRFLVGFGGTDVMPLPLVNNHATDRPRSLYDSSDEDINNGFDLSSFQKLEERCLHGVNAGKEATLDSWCFQGVPKVADLTSLIDVYIQ